MHSVVLVFAANTDCGKTLLSAGLVRAALNQSRRVRYVKPVQTGFDFDAAKVKQRNAQFPALLETETLFHFNEPVSPHLAATLQQQHASIPSSFDIRAKLDQAVAASKEQLVVVETAGGVLSPFPDGTPAADALERFYSKHHLTTRCVLVGDGRLGGISQTLCALEALEKRHYQVDSLVLFASEEQTNKYGNEQYLQSRFQRDPEVSRVPFDLQASAALGELPSDFFDHPVFLQVYNTLLLSPEAKDKRSLLEKL